MIKYKNIQLKSVYDLTHYLKNMSIKDKSYLFIRENEYKIESTIWEEMFEIYLETIPVGFVYINKQVEHRKAVINGIYIIPEYRTAHIALMAMLCVCVYIFNFLGYNKIESSTIEHNSPSYVFQDSYMKKEGTQIQSLYYQRKFYDQSLFGLRLFEFEELLEKHKIKLSDVRII
ncbi:MAG: GNAT family protein [Nitrosopumilaceae archaeon]|jgi:RimJ/RimL family protein N-acetyltransferase